jgi:hypothetical protein
MSPQSNRANAQLSTGPRTEEGKARSSQNALKHGLTSQQLVISPEERQAFDDLQARHYAEIEPRGALQQTFFDQLVFAAWNLRRIQILQAGIDPLDPLFDRLARHNTRFERSFQRALKELKALQTEAALHHLLPREVRHRTPFLAAALVIAKVISKRSQQRDQEHSRQPDPLTRQSAPASA